MQWNAEGFYLFLREEQNLIRKLLAECGWKQVTVGIGSSRSSGFSQS
jgi:hypothetical protein